jgi:hypothetical protein
MQLPAWPQTSALPPAGLQASSYVGEGVPVHGLQPAGLPPEVPPVDPVVPPVVPEVPPSPPPPTGVGMQTWATQVPVQQSVVSVQGEPTPACRLSGMQLRQSSEMSQPTGQAESQVPPDELQPAVPRATSAAAHDSAPSAKRAHPVRSCGFMFAIAARSFSSARALARQLAWPRPEGAAA